jgi:hypothetical protein
VATLVLGVINYLISSNKLDRLIESPIDTPMFRSVLKRLKVWRDLILHDQPVDPNFKPITGAGRQPSAPPSSIYTPFEHLAGLQRVEYLAKLADRNIYLNQPLKVDHYGTLQDPIIVPSLYDDRVVGCSGFPKESHDFMWFICRGVTRCIECGQAFKIERVGGEWHDAHEQASHEDHEHHTEKGDSHRDDVRKL